MLVLTRKKGESLVIGENIHLKIVDVQGDTVRLAIEAPRSISIWREELWESIVQENKEALGGADPATVQRLFQKHKPESRK